MTEAELQVLAERIASRLSASDGAFKALSDDVAKIKDDLEKVTKEMAELQAAAKAPPTFGTSLLTFANTVDWAVKQTSPWQWLIGLITVTGGSPVAHEILSVLKVGALGN
jgi:hypothetical protein